jgi:hypothetical protein
MGEETLTERMGRNDDSVSTRLLDKNYSPLIVRKYMVEGWPMYIGLICDVSLSDLDKVIQHLLSECRSKDMFKNDIQSLRNVTGVISDYLFSHYNSIKNGCVEGIAVLFYADKTFISSLWGDFMTHGSCKQELYFIINTLPHI